MKRAIIVHGWEGHPNEAWFPWLKANLEPRGFHVEIPQMPTPETPKIETWVPFLASVVGTPDADTYLIGHSIGVQTILRYLETIDTSIGGVLAVAGFFNLKPGSIGSPEDIQMAQPWLKTPMDFEKIRKNAGQITAIFSDNDKYVSLENADAFKEKLGAKTIIEHNRGHYGHHDLPFEISVALEEILKMTK